MRPLIIGVIGGSKRTTRHNPQTYEQAIEVGRLIAESGAILLCGGGSGVMEAAAKGAKSASSSSKTIGIMPGENGSQPANIDCAIFTGLLDARNYLNVVTADVLIALRGGAGTLSEIALGLKVGKPIIYLAYWKFLHQEETLRQPNDKVSYTETAEEAIRKALELVGIRKGERIESKVAFPPFPDQTENKQQLVNFVQNAMY